MVWIWPISYGHWFGYRNFYEHILNVYANAQYFPSLSRITREARVFICPSRLVPVLVILLSFMSLR